MLLTVLAWQLARRYDTLERGARFRLEAEEVRRAIAFRMETYVSALQQARGLFAGTHEVTRDEFRAYVRNMDLDTRYPGVLAIGFTRRVPPDAKRAFEEEVRREGFPDFHIWPASSGDAYPVVLIEPFDEMNQRAFGFDMYSDAARREAMDRAARRGTPSASAALTLVQEQRERETQRGFLIYVAAYRGADLVGFTYSPFRSGDLFRGIFSKDPLALDTIAYRSPRPKASCTRAPGNPRARSKSGWSPSQSRGARGRCGSSQPRRSTGSMRGARLSRSCWSEQS